MSTFLGDTCPVGETQNSSKYEEVTLHKLF